jgi:fucose 4-O-acetylase-like acetyltransferase
MQYNILSFEQSDRLKGILILLIIFGHISEIFGRYDMLMATLYSFHVVSFLLLPFLFNKDTINRKNIIKNLKRIYIPYTIFFILALTLYSLLQHKFNLSSALSTWFIGSSYYLKIDIGLRVLWFFQHLSPLYFLS